jgi:hypothetical protein
MKMNATGLAQRSNERLALSRTRPNGPAADTDQGIVGPADRWFDVLTHLAVDVGFGTFVLAVPPDPDALTTFIEDVAPEVRARVAEQRAWSRSTEA